MILINDRQADRSAYSGTGHSFWFDPPRSKKVVWPGLSTGLTDLPAPLSSNSDQTHHKPSCRRHAMSQVISPEPARGVLRVLPRRRLQFKRRQASFWLGRTGEMTGLASSLSPSRDDYIATAAIHHHGPAPTATGHYRAAVSCDDCPAAPSHDDVITEPATTLNHDVLASSK